MSVRELKHDRPSGQFSISGGLSASISFLSSPPPARSFTWAFFVRYLTLVPYSLLLNRTQMLATQANAILSITPYFCLPCLTVRIECSFLHLHALAGGRLQGTPWHLHNNIHASSRLKNDSFCQNRLPFSLPLG